MRRNDPINSAEHPDVRKCFRTPNTPAVHSTTYVKSGLTLEFDRIREYLGNDGDCTARIQKYLPATPVAPPKFRKRPDYPQLACEYADLTESEVFKKRTEVARLGGVGRVYVTKAMDHHWPRILGRKVDSKRLTTKTRVLVRKMA